MKPALLVMAAGMGSRYGGLKQMDPIGPNGEIIIDYSLYDAKRAGFEDVYFVIKHEIEEGFRRIIENGAGKHLNVHYVFQELSALPHGFEVPAGRAKPWGTAHAILMAKDELKAPFAVINADDYYGPGAFSSIYSFLENAEDKELYDYCMIGYRIENTVTEHGSVARGICRESAEGMLESIEERLNVRLNNGAAEFSEDGGESWTKIAAGTLVSMNMFGFTPSIMSELEKRFPLELRKIFSNDIAKGEFYIPKVVGALIEEGKAGVKVLPSYDRWYGVTYKEDKPSVINAMRSKIEEKLYPEKLW